MIKVDNIEVFNFEGAIRGLRNPLNSWDKIDSYMCDANHCHSCNIPDEERNCNKPDGYVIGENDLDLMRRLYKGGPEHRKYLRQIFVSMDITAPLYWWKEFDTYKVGTVANSCSTMHKIHSKKFTIDDFSVEHLDNFCGYNDKAKFLDTFNSVIDDLNLAREIYLDTKDKMYWWQMIQMLPTSYNQKRTVTMNYENIMTMIKQRSGHKLDEWNEFVNTLYELPYIKDIMSE